MNRLLRASAVALAAFSVAGCTSTNLVQTWRDPNYLSKPVNRVFIVAIAPTDVARVSFENALAQSIISKGFLAATASSVFPPGALDKEKVAEYVAQNQVDLVIVQRLTKQVTQEYVPPTVAYVPPAPYYGGWYGYYGYGYGAVYSPGYMAENVTVIAETNVYTARTNPEQLVWSGGSNTFNVESAQGAASSLAASVVADLIKAQILVK